MGVSSTTTACRVSFSKRSFLALFLRTCALFRGAVAFAALKALLFAVHGFLRVPTSQTSWVRLSIKLMDR